MPDITFTRNKGWYGRVRNLALFSDKYHLGDIKPGETKTFTLPDGARTIIGKMDWAKTKPLDLTFVEDGEHFDIIAWFTLNPLRNLGIITMPVRFESRIKAETDAAQQTANPAR